MKHEETSPSKISPNKAWRHCNKQTFRKSFSTIDRKSNLTTCDNEDEEYLEKTPPEVGTWISARFTLVYVAFFGFANLYALRVNLSIAILSMVNSTYLEMNSQQYDSKMCPESQSQVNYTDGEFNWDGNDRGLLLGAFFYGYICTQIPGGYLASRFGGKNLLGASIGSTAILTLLTPVAARGSFPLLIALRMAEGVSEGVAFPAMHSMFGAWAPPVDRSRLVSLTYAGCQFGTVLAQPISGLLSSSNIMGGWPSVFYFFGIFGLLWCCVWFLFAKDFPRDFKWISEAEVKYIERTVEQPDTNRSIPWKEIFLSKPAWAIMIAHFCHNWGFYTLLTSLPLYLKDVLRFNVKQNGLISALPYLVSWISIIVSGIIADLVREKGILNTTQTRKTFTTLSFIGSGVFLLSAGFVGCNKVAAVSCICIATGFSGLSFSGFYSNHVDIASRYSGILMGITNTWATIPGCVSPVIVGIVTGENPTHQNWLIVFYISAAVYLAGAILYILLGSGIEQKWNRSYKVKEELSPLLEEKNN